MIIGKTLSALLGGVLLATCALAHADLAKVISLEYGIESSTDIAILPTSSSSSITLTCASCASRTYPVTTDTKYFIGPTSVSLAELNAFARGRAVNFTFFITKDGSAVTRIVMSIASGASTPAATTNQPRAR